MKRYRCPVCKALFARKLPCQEHVCSQHSKEKPYTCGCGNKFGFRNVFLIHKNDCDQAADALEEDMPDVEVVTDIEDEGQEGME
jgi:hypothetical protein